MLHPVAKEPGVRPSPSSRKPSRDAGEKSGAGNRDRTGDIQLGKIEIGSGIAGDPWGRGAGRAFLVVPSHPTGIPKQHREQSANSQGGRSSRPGPRAGPGTSSPALRSPCIRRSTSWDQPSCLSATVEKDPGGRRSRLQIQRLSSENQLTVTLIASASGAGMFTTTRNRCPSAVTS